MAAPLGNQNAAKAKRWQKAIERALARSSGESVDAGLDTAANKLVSAANAGDQWALKELGERIDGKVAQAIIGDSSEDPLNVKVQGAIELVRPASEG